MKYLKKYNESKIDRSKYLDLGDILQDFFDEHEYQMIPSSLEYDSDEYEDYISTPVNGDGCLTKCWDFKYSTDRNSEIKSIKVFSMSNAELLKLQNYLTLENDRVRSLTGLNTLISNEEIDDDINDATIKLVDDKTYNKNKRKLIDKSVTDYMKGFSRKFLLLSDDKKDEIIELVNNIRDIMDEG